MAADFQPVASLADMVGVMDHPGREPQRLALELGEDSEIVQAGVAVMAPLTAYHSSSTVSKSAGRIISRSSQSSE